MAKEYDNFFDFPSGARCAVREVKYISPIRKNGDFEYYFEVMGDGFNHREEFRYPVAPNQPSPVAQCVKTRNEFIERHKFLNQY